MHARLVPLLLALAPSAAAQTSPPFAFEMAYEHGSGSLVSAADAPVLVHGHTVHVAGATSLRLFFEEIDVPGGGWLDVIAHDGQVQRLTSQEAVKWHHTSAFFNGETLTLELWAAPGERASFVLSHLLVGVPSFGDTLCGEDDRVPSDDNRSVRFLNSSGTSACTGWLAGADDCAFCAGHCFPTFASVGEVNVPPSLSNGALQHPPLEDQFPIDEIDWLNGGTGDDWAIAQLQPNNLGQTPSSLWGYFELGFFLPDVGETIRITGYGTDDGADNQTNQTNAGPLASAGGTTLEYVVDTMNGNSGSPVIHEATGQAIGIHTHGGCTFSGGDNLGTSLLHPAFQSAWMDHCAQGPPGVPVAAFTTSTAEVVEGQPVHFSDDSTGIPSSWSWDFDDDGVEDSTAKNPSHTYEDPGLYTVSLTVSNDFGTDTSVQQDLVQVNPVSPVSLPYVEDFTDGLSTAGDWVFFSSNEFGAIEAGGSGAPSPGSGDPALTLASSSDGQYVQNDAILNVDMTGAGSAILTYWFKRTADENDPEDGLWMTDGVTEVLVQDHGAASSAWTEYEIDLVAVAMQNGVALSDDFRLVWRQFDNFTLGTDGHLVDDVRIQAETLLTADVSAIFASAGGTQNFELDAGAGLAGSYYQLLGTTSGTAPGMAFDGFTIPLNPDFYFSRTLSNPNAFPLSSSAGFLDANGQAQASFSIPPGFELFTGMTLHHAFLTGIPATNDLTSVSNTVPLVVLP